MKNPIQRLMETFVQKANNKSLTFAWLMSITMIAIATLQTWSLIGDVISQTTIGIFMLYGGIVQLFEVFLENGFSYKQKGDVIGTVVGTFAIAYSIGIFTGSQSTIATTGGVQGGVLLFLIVSLVWEGIFNRT
jgi:fatty acid desaturase